VQAMFTKRWWLGWAGLREKAAEEREPEELARGLRYPQGPDSPRSFAKPLNPTGIGP
jgi:hypothetical protein